MAVKVRIYALDLGTGSTTAGLCIAIDSLDSEGKLCRVKPPGARMTEVQDWTGGNRNDATGNICVPTDLIYDRRSRQLLFSGFEASQYLNDPDPEIKRELVFHVEHIKLLLPDPDEAEQPTPASTRHRALRNEIRRVLNMEPADVFQDLMDVLMDQIMTSSIRKNGPPHQNDKIELILAFPSGWREHIHTMVAEIGSKAMKKAFQTHDLLNMQFGTENVYTVSETLCGVKEWLRNAIAEAAVTNDLDAQGTNLDEFNVGDWFLPCDVGAGTGCITPLRLVSKYPLQVDQLAPTKSLEVSGEAVEAEFERWIRPHISTRDYPGNMEQLITRICREFKEEKKFCGLPPRLGSKTWNLAVPRLRSNASKGFERDRLKIDRNRLDECFDPSIDLLGAEFEKTLNRYPKIKAIIFLGQLGGSSEYLRNKMASSHIAQRVKVLHSQSGKLSVVRGAMSERLQLNNSFVRQFKTMKSYGTLIALKWYAGSEATQLFPNAKSDGAVDFEQDGSDRYLKVIEWAIPKGTILDNGEGQDVGMDLKRYHTWPANETEIWFQDTIVISDEAPPPPQIGGTSYTLWTEAHEANKLFQNNERVQVQRKEFSWDITKSEKLDADGKLIGSYGIGDLDYYSRGKKADRYRRLDYKPVWNITEMQIKLYVQPLFPNPIGRLTTQLANEISPNPDERILGGEFRSKALERDIQIVAEASSAPVKDPVASIPDDQALPETLADILGRPGAEFVEALGAENRQSLPRPFHSRLSPSHTVRRTTPNMNSANGPGLTYDHHQRPRSPPPGTSQNGPIKPHSFASPNLSKVDGRRRDGCYTCKARKKRCDCTFTITDNKVSCNACMQHRIDCVLDPPFWAKDPEQVKRKKEERKKQLKLGKRKVREESDSSETFPRARSSTLAHDLHNQQQAALRSIERSVYDDYGSDNTQTMAASQKGRGRFMAIRGGKHDFKNIRH